LVAVTLAGGALSGCAATMVVQSGLGNPHTGTPEEVLRYDWAGRCAGDEGSPVHLLDHFIRPGQHRGRDRQAQGLGGLQVDHKLELGGLLDGEVGWLGTPENLVDVEGGALGQTSLIRSVG
jgi:hypothetical protein